MQMVLILQIHTCSNAIKIIKTLHIVYCSIYYPSFDMIHGIDAVSKQTP